MLFCNQIKYVQKLLPQNILAMLCGCILTLSFAPFDFWPTIFVAISFVFYLLQNSTNKKEAFWLGFCFAFAFFVSSIYWISASLLVDAKHFAWLIPFAITLIPALLATYYGLIFIIFTVLKQKFKLNIWQKALLFSLLWLIAEIARSTLFSGFSWNLLGYVSLSMPYIAQTADIWGVYGLSFCLCFCSIFSITWFNQRKQKEYWQYFGFATFIMIFCLLYGFFRLNYIKTTTNKTWQIRLVQANIPQSTKWEETDKLKNLNHHIQLSQNNSHLDAIIWPETAIPFAVSNLNTHQLQQSLQSAIPKNGSLISGLIYIDYQNSDLQIFNSAIHLNNQKSEFYHKHHLVPFGEYVPLHKYFHFLFLDETLKTITNDAVNFSQGTGPQTLFANNFSFSPLICYEVIFGTKIINKQNPPDILINLTNDGWFGKTIGPYQHLAHAQMRAIEYRKPLLRVAGTGISAYINEYGKVVNHIPLQETKFLDVEVHESQLNSLYTKLLL